MKYGACRAVIVASILSFAVVSCTQELERHTETELLLGTVLTVTLYGDDTGPIFDQIFERVAEIESKMSTSEDDYQTTELLEVNRAAGDRPIEVSSDTFYVVEQALEYSRLSNGRFDLSVAPLVGLWGIGTDSAQVPSEQRINDALAKVDYSKVELSQDREAIYLPERGMGVEVGAIAKGYAADEAGRIIRESGKDSALLDFGGNILTIGTKPDGSLWRIGVQLPESQARRGVFIGIAEVEDLSVVTSGTYERFFVQDDVRYHHILDTETGYPVRNRLESVTIVTEDSIRADALSTSIFAMGLEEGLRFAEELSDAEALFVTEDKEIHMTSGMGDFFRLTNNEYETMTGGEQ
ncbi:MAG: FAD:protein FMN transferase [Spirochaetales bacterium]